MGKTNAFSDNFLKHVFQNANIAGIGDATGVRGSTTAGSLYVSLHTSSPGTGGDQTTNEATYTGYARQAVARSSSGWDEASQVVSNHSAITFPACTGGSNTITHFGIGTDVSGAGNLLWFGALTASLAVSNGITPSFAAGSLTDTES